LYHIIISNNQSLKWFLSYLKDRTRIVRCIFGNELGINCGVPQWSDSGPILFIMYINSICDLKIDGSITMYVKDICLVYSNILWASVYTKASTALKKIIKKITLHFNFCYLPSAEIEITDNLYNPNSCIIKSRLLRLNLWLKHDICL